MSIASSSSSLATLTPTTHPLHHHHQFHPSKPLHFSSSPSAVPTVRCGPRDNRPPLVRGRTLSTEAILAVQALKRASPDETKLESVVSKTFSRLVKQDLLAALAELRRQDHCDLALLVFNSAVRTEPWFGNDYAVYAEMVRMLGRNGKREEMERLVRDLVGGGVSDEDLRGLARLLKALVGAGEGELVREVYEAMKRGGVVADEFVFRVLKRGLEGVEGGDVLVGELERDFSAGALR
ncbi:hypothetical protein QJS10_CPA07g01059 [Acorus calamus]|uniref:Uncharacterized protein n=1 Tax=Acorus calamus TaxID=4465 RepID=A0AAV9EHV9_ACOCL|nr:hypothetical protein QJS10_CPA07g01059 [Acorus calamus]